MTVSARTEAALRDAMERLLAGNPQRTDGRLIKDNLWKEAQVSRATMNRATALVAEWDQRTATADPCTPGEARRDTQLRELRAVLAERQREIVQLRGQLDAAATVIAALHADNTALRDQLHRPTNVVALHSPTNNPPETSHVS